MNATADTGDLLDARDRALIGAVQDGLPLASRPFAALGERLAMPEHEVIDRVRRLSARGLIKRWGVIVRHRELGYRANAMVVWDVPDRTVDTLGRRLGEFSFVTLCYKRPRRPPDWPYNLFCMIHGRDRAAVGALVERLVQALALQAIPHETLFSRRCFKQRGARYGK